VIVATAGHVDHGKSTLVRLLTGIDPDRWAEEHRRGLTIDLGFAFADLPDGTALAMVDVPGHQRFAANMLAGAHAVDVALFVVSACEGWMPQSEEHLMVLEHLGARSGVIALTHADRVDAAGLGAASAAVRSRLAGTFLRGARILPVDGRGGPRLDALAAELARLVGAVPAPPDLGRPRLWVDRAFVLDGLGRVLTGTLTGGTIDVGDRLDVADPAAGGDGGHALRGAGGGGAGVDTADGTHRVRSLHVNGVTAAHAAPGNRVAVRLAGPAPAARRGLRRGVALVRPGQWMAGRHLHVALTPVRGRHRPAPRGGYTLVLGTAQWPVELRRPARSAAAGGAVSRGVLDGPDGAAGSGVDIVRLHARSPVAPVAPGDRVVLRDSSAAVVAGGVVLAVDTTVRRLPPDALAARLASLPRSASIGRSPSGDRSASGERSASGDHAGGGAGRGNGALARALVAEAGGAMAVVDLRRAVGPLVAPVSPATGAESGAEGIVVLGDLAVDAAALGRRQAQLELAMGVPADGAGRAPEGATMPVDPLGRAAVGRLLLTGRAVAVDGRLWAAGSGGPLRHRRELARRVVAEAGDSPRAPAALAAAAGVSGRVVTDLLAAGDLVAVADGLVASAASWRRWQGAISERLQVGPATLAELRDALGLSRREALAVLGSTDTAGLTVRVGDRRVLGAGPARPAPANDGDGPSRS